MSETQTREAGDDAPDLCEVIAEAQLAMLGELAEIGMKIARAIGERAVLPPPADPETPAVRDPLDAFAKVSRAIRLTLALQSKTAQDLRNLRSGLVVEREERRQRAVKTAEEAETARLQARERRVRDLAVEAIEAEAPDFKTFFALEECLDERLAEDEAYDRLLDLPLKETIAHICADLGLAPDWSRWDGEGWAPRTPFSRPPSSWFHQPRTRAITHEERCAHVRGGGAPPGFGREDSPRGDPAASP